MAVYSAGRSSGPVLRSISAPDRFNRRSSTHYSSSFSTVVQTADATHRPAYNRTSSAQNRAITVSNRVEKPPAGSVPPKRTCMCSPTNHPGSFRCSLHRSGSSNSNRVSDHCQTVSCGSSSGLNMRRSAMKNSLIRIGTEGDMVKRALAALIRPSSHHQRRRREFQQRPSRLSVMSNA